VCGQPRHRSAAPRHRRHPALSRMQSGERLHLCADIRGGVEQEPPLMVRAHATDDCVRAWHGREPSRIARHHGHPQFHCRKPPLAADTSPATTCLLLESKGGWGAGHAIRRPNQPPFSCQSNWATYMVTSGAHPISSNSGVSQDSIAYLLRRTEREITIAAFPDNASGRGGRQLR
jgi:hypothetical protein